MSNTQQNQQKDYIDKTYFDSATGEEITVRKEICKRCGYPIRLDGGGHNECRRAFLEEEAAIREKQRQRECMMKFGRVVSRQEEEWMTYPDSRVPGYSNTYNQYRKRIEEEKKQAHFDKLRQRELRKEKLPRLEQELRSLRGRILRDEEETAEEAKTAADATKDATKENEANATTPK